MGFTVVVQRLETLLELCDLHVEPFSLEPLLQIRPIRERPPIHHQRSENAQSLRIFHPRDVQRCSRSDIRELTLNGHKGPAQPLIGEIPLIHVASPGRIGQDHAEQLRLGSVERALSLFALVPVTLASGSNRTLHGLEIHTD